MPPERLKGAKCRFVLFLGFYIAALLLRNRRPDWCKRLMISAAPTVIAAAAWRLWTAVVGTSLEATVAGTISTFAEVFGGCIEVQ